jgi:hypothetical protein
VIDINQLGVLHKSNFFIAMSYFDWPIAKKSWLCGGSPKIEDSIKRWSASPFGEKGRTLGKTYEIKARCYW